MIDSTNILADDIDLLGNAVWVVLFIIIGIISVIIKGVEKSRNAKAAEEEASLAGANPPLKPPPLRILYPNEDDCFQRLREAGHLRQEIGLRSSSKGTTHWYLNGDYLGHSEAGRPLPWPLVRGSHVLACCDAGGRTARIAFRVD